MGKNYKIKESTKNRNRIFAKNRYRINIINKQIDRIMTDVYHTDHFNTDYRPNVEEVLKKDIKASKRYGGRYIISKKAFKRVREKFDYAKVWKSTKETKGHITTWNLKKTQKTISQNLYRSYSSIKYRTLDKTQKQDIKNIFKDWKEKKIKSLLEKGEITKRSEYSAKLDTLDKFRRFVYAENIDKIIERLNYYYKDEVDLAKYEGEIYNETSLSKRELLQAFNIKRNFE